MILQTGTLLQGGKYRIVRFINNGGFGCTYEAVHVMLGKRVAIKELFPSDLCYRTEGSVRVTIDNPEKRPLMQRLLKKFMEEAIALSQFNHPGIVRVTDVFEENGTAYYVMDYIDGVSLSQLVHKHGPLSEREALRYIRQVCDALAYVHARNRLHLDIKPANIMVDAKNDAVLIDFGVSKQYDEVNGQNTSTLMGFSPGYAPPEQTARAITAFLPATDIYSLGATLYYLLTADEPLESSLRISGDEASDLPDSVSWPTRNAVDRAMALSKKDRPQTVADFLVLLPGEADQAPAARKTEKMEYRAPVEEVAEKKPEPSRKPSRKAAISIAAASALALSIVAYFAFFSKSEPAKEDVAIAMADTTDVAFVPLTADTTVTKEIIPSTETTSPSKEISKPTTETGKKKEEPKEKKIEKKKYDWEESLCEGLAQVRLNGKWGYIDKTGKEVIPLKYGAASEFHEGLAAVEINGKCGYIDKTGKEVIPLKYDHLYNNFIEGLAGVKLNGKWGYIDKTGKEVVPLRYDDVGIFSEGLAIVKSNGKYGFIDKTGKEVIPLKYDGVGAFREGLAKVKLNEKYGFIDKTGKEAIPLKYDEAYVFSDGRARVILNGKKFYIDKNGNRVE